MSENTGFLFVPEHIMANTELSVQEKVVYGRVIGLTKQEGYCFATNEWIGEQVGLSGSMVSKHLSSLNKKGLIRIEVNKIKKGSFMDKITVSNQIKWGTTRKIFAFFSENSSPSTINGEPPSTINGEYSRTDIEDREGGARRDEPTPPSDLPLYKDFSQQEQLQLLQSIMGIYEKVDFGAINLRVKNSKSRADVLQTVYHWWFQDIHEGKLGSNKYIANEDAIYVDAVPTSFVEAQTLMNERLIEKEKLEPGFISSHNKTSPKYDL
jgi:DNA-binding transcriptional ArsR family regulator